ncbi:MAG TPA: endonuclease/exonuclease/phosphatase family protein [Patescibacteria group bacterium]|nr:endonuclease/exonuclease/phosphatase family protein [Patescibacteria group bacterium]
MFRLLSYNIYFGKKLDIILDWLAEIERKKNTFDIMCFQEFPYEKIDTCMRSRKSTSNYRFAPSIYLGGKIYGQLTIFNQNKLKIINDTELLLGASRIEKSMSYLLKRSTKRKSLLTLFETNTHKKLMVANTHLSIGLNKLRINQLKKIFIQVQTIPNTLIVGDLNYTSALPRFSLKRLIKKYQFEDATRNLKTHRILFLRHQLDYIFTKSVSVTRVRAEQLPFSDHYPLIAQFEI